MASLPPPPRRYTVEHARDRRASRFVALVAAAAILMAVPFAVVHPAGGVRALFGWEDVHVPLLVGSTGTLPGTGVRITLLTLSGNQFLPYAGGASIKQWSAEVKVDNLSMHSLTLAPWRLRGKDRHEYAPSENIGVNSLPDRTTLSPGQSLRGTVTFRVPQDVTALWLRYGVPAFTAPVLYFDGT